jgi:hypothetical protein
LKNEKVCVEEDDVARCIEDISLLLTASPTPNRNYITVLLKLAPPLFDALLIAGQCKSYLKSSLRDTLSVLFKTAQKAPAASAFVAALLQQKGLSLTLHECYKTSRETTIGIRPGSCGGLKIDSALESDRSFTERIADDIDSTFAEKLDER